MWILGLKGLTQGADLQTILFIHFVLINFGLTE